MGDSCLLAPPLVEAFMMDCCLSQPVSVVCTTFGFLSDVEAARCCLFISLWLDVVAATNAVVVFLKSVWIDSLSDVEADDEDDELTERRQLLPLTTSSPSSTGGCCWRWSLACNEVAETEAEDDEDDELSLFRCFCRCCCSSLSEVVAVSMLPSLLLLLALLPELLVSSHCCEKLLVFKFIGCEVIASFFICLITAVAL